MPSRIDIEEAAVKTEQQHGVFLMLNNAHIHTACIDYTV